MNGKEKKVEEGLGKRKKVEEERGAREDGNITWKKRRRREK